MPFRSPVQIRCWWKRGRPTCVILTSVGDVMEPADLGHESFDEVEVAAGDPNDRVEQLKLNPTVGIGQSKGWGKTYDWSPVGNVRRHPGKPEGAGEMALINASNALIEVPLVWWTSI